MKSIAILTDSNSGISQKQANELDVYVLPMPFIINGKEYFEDINLTQEKFYELLKDESSVISTSQPSVGSLLKTWNDLLKQYDEIVYIPMSSGLSSSCQTAKTLALDYENRVFVVDNQRISVTQRQSVLDAIALKNKGLSGEEIKEFLEKIKLEASIYIMVDTLNYLKKGGRLTPAVAAIGTLLKIKPVLQIQGEKLDAFSLARTLKKAKEIMKKAIEKDIHNRFGGADNVEIHIAHTQNLENAILLKEELLELYPNHDIYIDHLSLSVSCHIGPGSLAIAISKKYDR